MEAYVIKNDKKIFYKYLDNANNYTNYVVIGSRPYNNISLNFTLDLFEKNIHCNQLLPNNNNGTKIDEVYLNGHVYDYTMLSKDDEERKRRRKGYVNMFNEEYVKKYDDFDISRWVKIYRQNHKDKSEMNIWLKKKKLELIKSPILRTGFNAIWMLMKRGKINIFVHGFSLSGDHKKLSMNKNLPNTSDCHDVKSEQKCLINLHNLNYIDATMCCLEDNVIPTFDCKHIKPKLTVLLLFLKQTGIITLINYFDDKEIENIKKEVLRVFDKRQKMIQISDKEGCSNDERIFNIQNESEYISKTFSKNILFNEIASSYTNLKLNKKTLANRLTYEKDKTKNSGAGWHRDRHDMQFKCLMYLTDVTKKNGNFQFITNSSKRYIGCPPPRTSNCNTRFTDATINEVLKNNSNCHLHDIIGKRGTVVIADTSYIHRGNIIQEGEQLALTQYFI